MKTKACIFAFAWTFSCNIFQDRGEQLCLQFEICKVNFGKKTFYQSEDTYTRIPIGGEIASF